MLFIDRLLGQVEFVCNLLQVDYTTETSIYERDTVFVEVGGGLDEVCAYQIISIIVTYAPSGGLFTALGHLMLLHCSPAVIVFETCESSSEPVIDGASDIPQQ